MTLPKFIPFRSVINFLQRSAFWDLADFWPIFRLSERPKVCAFIAQKLNKLRRPFFIFPDNFCRSIRIWKNIPSGGHGSGATAPQNRFQKLKFQNFALFREATEPKCFAPAAQNQFYFAPHLVSLLQKKIQNFAEFRRFFELHENFN